MGVHTCDKRQTKTYIQDTFGSNFYIIPPFTEQDELWQADVRETDEETDARTKVALDCIFHGKGNCTHVHPTYTLKILVDSALTQTYLLLLMVAPSALYSGLLATGNTLYLPEVGVHSFSDLTTLTFGGTSAVVPVLLKGAKA